MIFSWKKKAFFILILKEIFIEEIIALFKKKISKNIIKERKKTKPEIELKVKKNVITMWLYMWEVNKKCVVMHIHSSFINFVNKIHQQPKHHKKTTTTYKIKTAADYKFIISDQKKIVFSKWLLKAYVVLFFKKRTRKEEIKVI